MGWGVPQAPAQRFGLGLAQITAQAEQLEPPDQVVAEAHQRCDQENLHAQLKGEVRALHAPVNTLNANWAYLVMASLAWTLKA